MQFVCKSFSDLKVILESLNRTDPDIDFSIVHSKGEFWIEDKVPLIRTWEILICHGTAKKIIEDMYDKLLKKWVR